MGFHQAKWDEPLIIERSYRGRIAHLPPLPTDEECKALKVDPMGIIPEGLRRTSLFGLPEISEPEVIRHFTRLSQQVYSPDLGIYPLGSCTMKYNPKICDAVVQSHKIEKMHPEQPESTVQGVLAILYKLERMLCEITGMSRNVPAAGGRCTGRVSRNTHRQGVSSCEGRIRCQNRDARARLFSWNEPGERGDGRIPGSSRAIGQSWNGRLERAASSSRTQDGRTYDYV